MEKIYFFTEDFIKKNQQYVTKCDCSLPGCTLLMYVPPSKDKTNVITIDFKNKRKIK